MSRNFGLNLQYHELGSSNNELPQFYLEFEFKYKYRRLLNNLEGQVREIQFCPINETRSLPLPIDPYILSDSYRCHYHIYNLLFSLNIVDRGLCSFLVPNLASSLTFARQKFFMGFHAVAEVEIVQEEIIDAEELVMMSFIMDADDTVVERSRSGGVSKSGITRLKKAGRLITCGDCDDDCAICLEKLCSEVNDGAIKMPNCDHIFHEKCIFRWLKDQTNCPMCRRQVV